MSNIRTKNWDIFCRIVDNFGDIGVCWRLAQQLASEHKLNIRLFIDDLAVAQKIITALNVSLEKQTVNQIEIYTWQSANQIAAADIALETFSCELPVAYLKSMSENSIWINLEYLSAESWVADFHARSSNNTQPLRHFYFPGFTEATGGLIREANIVQENQSIANNKVLQKAFLESIHVSYNDAFKVSLFCYPHAPIHSLLSTMAASNRRIDCYVPNSSILANIANYFNLHDTPIQVGTKLSSHNLHLHVLPFLNQTDYDKLLASCNLNFVRGEDSWIRAIWASKPFIWQPYLQSEDTHITKLNAFIDLFYRDAEKSLKDAVRGIHASWVNGNITTLTWQNYLNQHERISQFTSEQASHLATQSDLATKLVTFLQKVRDKV